MKARSLFALLAVLLVAAACSSPPELRNAQFLDDISLTNNEPCQAPCWHGITPGVTTWSDAITILQDDGTLSDVTTEANEESGEIAATFQKANGVACCLIYTKDGEFVDQILLQLAPINLLGDVIENFGEPSFFSGTEVSPEQAAAALFYPDQQLVVYAFVAGAESGEISARSEIFATLYLTEDDMQQVLSTSNLHDFVGYDTFKNYIERPFDITPAPTADVPTEDSSDDQTAEPTATTEG
jgi:hypothetical protein